MATRRHRRPCSGRCATRPRPDRAGRQLHRQGRRQARRRQPCRLRALASARARQPRHRQRGADHARVGDPRPCGSEDHVGLRPRPAGRELGAIPEDEVIGFALHRSGARHSTDLRASRRHLGSDFRWSFLYAPLRLNCRDRERQTPEGTELGTSGACSRSVRMRKRTKADLWVDIIIIGGVVAVLGLASTSAFFHWLDTHARAFG